MPANLEHKNEGLGWKSRSKMVESQQGSTAVSDTVFGGWGRNADAGALTKAKRKFQGNPGWTSSGVSQALKPSSEVPSSPAAKSETGQLELQAKRPGVRVAPKWLSTGVTDAFKAWSEPAPEEERTYKASDIHGIAPKWVSAGVTEALDVAPNWQGSNSWRFEPTESEYTASSYLTPRAESPRSFANIYDMHMVHRQGQSNHGDEFARYGIRHPELGHSISAGQYGAIPSGQLKLTKDMFEGFRIRNQPPLPVESACPEVCAPGNTRGRERKSYPEHSVFSIPRKHPVVDPFQWEDKRKRHAYRFHDKEMRHGKKQYRNERYVPDGGYGGKWDCAAQWWVHDSPDEVTCHGRLLSSRVTKPDHKVITSTTSELFAGAPPRSQGKRSFGVMSTSDAGAYSEPPVFSAAFTPDGKTTATDKKDKARHQFAPPPRQPSTSAHSERSVKSQPEASVTRSKESGSRIDGRSPAGSRQGSVPSYGSPAGSRQGSVPSRGPPADSRQGSAPPSRGSPSGSHKASQPSRSASEASRSRRSSRSGDVGEPHHMKPSIRSGSRASQSTSARSSKQVSLRSHSSSSSRTSRSSQLTVSTQPHTPLIDKGIHPTTPAGARSMIEQLWQ